jgi:hypothetical protein
MRLTVAELEKYLDNKYSTDLHIYTEIDHDAAELLANSGVGELNLSGLESLPISVARGLSTYDGSLILAGLETISHEIARIFEFYSAQKLDLSGLTQIDVEIATAFSAYKGELYLNGVEKVDGEIVNILLNREEYTTFEGLISLDEKSAQLIVKFESRDNWTVEFFNLKELTAGAAKMLVDADFALLFPALESIDEETASELANCTGWLGLDALTSISDEIAYQLSGHGGWTLDLNGLEHISIKSAEYLSEFRGDDLLLGGLKKLDGPTAFHLANLEHRVYVPESTQKTNLAMFYLSKSYRYSHFPLPIFDDSDAMEMSLIDFKKMDLDPILVDIKDSEGFLTLVQSLIKRPIYNEMDFGDIYIERIEPQAAKLIANSQKAVLNFSDLKSIDSSVANSFAEHSGELLKLKGLKTLSPDAAKQLARYQGKQLDLSGLETLLPETAKALSAYRGILNISGLISVDSEIAGILAKNEGTLVLSGIDYLSDEEAGILATHQGVIYISNTTEIFPCESYSERDSRLGIKVLNDSPAHLSLVEKIASQIAPLGNGTFRLYSIGDRAAEILTNGKVEFKIVSIEDF